MSRNIYKIVECFNNHIEIPKYSRMIPYSEIEANDYNLNIPRYIDSNEEEDLQDISAHLSGGIPQNDIERLGPYWDVFPNLRSELFENTKRDGYLQLRVGKEEMRYYLENYSIALSDHSDA